ncbi:MAG: hypothetical protein ABEI78_01320 [Candidatus Nanohaloarchaea archaeon]
MSKMLQYLKTAKKIFDGALRNIRAGRISLIFYVYYFYRHFTSEFRHLPSNRGLTEFLTSFTQLSQEKVEEDKLSSIFEYDWDNLIILDACRFDLFNEVTGLEGFRYTLASGTKQYIRENYRQGDFSDIVYISDNPHFHESKFSKLTGRKPEETFQAVFHSYLEGETHQNFHTESVKKDAITAEKLFKNERKIIHFLLPHMPTISDDNDINWRTAERKEYSTDEVWQGYKENLNFVLEEVKSLSESLEGKTLITSDHGNLFNSNGVYGHTTNLPIKGLRKVPLCDAEDIKR